MANLERRVAQLEGTRANPDLQDMTDDELDAHIQTLEPGSHQLFSAVVGKILRHPSPVPIVVDDPAYAKD